MATTGQELVHDLQDSKKRKLEEGPEGNGGLPILTREELKKTLEALNKDQLIEFLLKVGVRDAAVFEELREFASQDPATRKLFVRGLAWETTTEALRDAFTQYGEVEDCAVIVEKATKRSKGYGFVRYKSMASALLALREPSKMIDGRMTVCNLAAAGNQSSSDSDLDQRKLFVSSLAYETTSDTLLKEFSKYGEVEEGAVAYDKNTNKSRGFAFVTYRTVEGARGALVDRQKVIDGRTVQCKLASEGAKDKTANVQQQLQQAQQLQQQFSLAAYTPTFNPQVEFTTLVPGQTLQGLTANQFLNVAHPPSTPYPGTTQYVSQYNQVPSLGAFGSATALGAALGGTSSTLGVLGSGTIGQNYLGDGRSQVFATQVPTGGQSSQVQSYFGQSTR